MQTSCGGGGTKRTFLNDLDGLQLKAAASFTFVPNQFWWQMRQDYENSYQIKVSAGWKIDAAPQPVVHFC